MSNRTNNIQRSPAGLGCLPTIFIILLVLKLLGLTAMSWWWVFSPLFIQLGFFIVFIFILAVLVPRAMGRNMKQ